MPDVEARENVFLCFPRRRPVVAKAAAPEISPVENKSSTVRRVVDSKPEVIHVLLNRDQKNGNQ